MPPLNRDEGASLLTLSDSDVTWLIKFERFERDIRTFQVFAPSFRFAPTFGILLTLTSLLERHKTKAHLAGRLDSFPDAEVDNNPTKKKTHGKFKPDFTGIINSWGDLEHVVAEIMKQQNMSQPSDDCLGSFVSVTYREY